MFESDTWPCLTLLPYNVITFTASIKKSPHEYSSLFEGSEGNMDLF